MKNTAKKIAVVILISIGFMATAQESTYDVENIFFNDSINQPFPSVQTSITVKLTADQFSEVDTIIITGINSKAGSLSKHIAKINPKTGFVIRDESDRSVINGYLTNDMDYDNLQTLLKEFHQDPSLGVHPMVFADPRQNAFLIKMFQRNSKDVEFQYDVCIVYKTGKRAKLINDRTSSITKPFAQNTKTQ